MAAIDVRQTFVGDRELVFSRLADHVRFLSGRGLSCRMLEAGDRDRNGVGALRELRAPGLVLCERITACDPPERLAYRIERAELAGWVLPFRHEDGSLVVHPLTRGCAVHWHSRFTVPVPLVGAVLASLLARRAAATFASLLARLARQLEAGAG